MYPRRFASQYTMSYQSFLQTGGIALGPPSNAIARLLPYFSAPASLNSKHYAQALLTALD
jgi:hypothetical protein